MKTLLLPLFGDHSDQLGLSTAVTLARVFSLHMDVIHIRSDPATIFSSIAPNGMGLALTVPSIVEQIEEQENARADRARHYYKAFCEKEKLPVSEVPPGPRGVSVSWREIKGNDVDVIVQLGRLRDIVVIANAPRTSRLFPRELGELFGIGRPLLLAGPKVHKSIGRRISVAWKSVPEAARAIGAAMPLLAKAEQISVFSIEEELNRQTSLDLLIKQLRWHRLPVEGRVISPRSQPAPEALLSAAMDMKADLLVMGAYGHGRVRETIFGGFTHHMLSGVHLPIFMLH